MQSFQELNKVTDAVIGSAIEVHKKLGPGLLESAYKECLAREFTLRGINYEKEKPLPVEYKGVRLECGYRLDFLVEKCVVLELKSVEAIPPVYEAQLLTYLSLGNYKFGLLINFNVNKLVEGIGRKIL